MKTPQECSCLIDIREGIDSIDKEIVILLAKRLGYVLAAARFKPTKESIPAPERVQAMLEQRRSWAAEQGFSEEFTEELFKAITSWFISRQVNHWEMTRGNEGAQS